MIAQTNAFDVWIAMLSILGGIAVPVVVGLLLGILRRTRSTDKQLKPTNGVPVAETVEAAHHAAQRAENLGRSNNIRMIGLEVQFSEQNTHLFQISKKLDEHIETTVPVAEYVQEQKAKEEEA